MKEDHDHFWGTGLGALQAILKEVDRAGAIVVGGPGAGKTSLVRAVLRSDVHPASLTLQCSAALADVAYGALSPFLTDLDDIRGPVDVLRAMQRRLDVSAERPPADGSPAAAPTAQRPVIVVEDCQFLDAASAFVLAQLAQNHEAVLLATSVGLRGESGVNALVDAGLLATVPLPPLGMGETRALVESLVGGTPTDGAVRTILGMTGGSPRLVEAFVASAMDQGIIVVDQGPDSRAGRVVDVPWTLLRPAPSLDERLIGAVEGMHAELTDEQQVAVTMLALAGRMPRTLLRAVAGDQGQDLAAVHVTRYTDGDLVELSSVLYGEVVRATIPPGRSAALLEQWQSIGGAAVRPSCGRSVTWALDNGAPVAEPDRVAAGYQCLAALELSSAWSLATRNPPSEGPRLLLLRAEVMLAAARTWSARADLVELADAVDDDDLVTEILCVLAMDLVRCGDPTEPWEALRQVWSEYLDRVSQQGREASLATGPLADWLSAPDLADPGADWPPVVDRSAELVADPQIHPAVRCMAHWLRGQLLSGAGRLVDAAGEASLAYDEVVRTPRMVSMMGGHALVQLVMSLLQTGDLDTADLLLTAQREGPVHRWHAWSGTVQALQGFVDLLRGDLRQGTRELRHARADLAQADPHQLMPLVDAVHALVAGPPLASAGTGGSVVDVIRAHGRRGPADRWLLATAIAAMADELGTAATPEQRPLWRRVLDDPAMDRYPVVRREVLFLAATSHPPTENDAEIIARLHHACTDLDGARSSTMRTAYDPAVTSDAVRLAEVAGSLRASGDLAVAADAWARVVMLHHRANDLRRRGEALRHLQDVVQVLGGVPSRYVREALDLGALTDREHEIVRLALQGRSNADIARALVVSPRTVEGHLYRVFTKLGISDRTELREPRL